MSKDVEAKAKQIREKIDEGYNAIGHGLICLVEAGQMLSEERPKFGYGQWLPFLKSVGISSQDASEFMAIADQWGNEKVELLPKSRKEARRLLKAARQETETSEPVGTSKVTDDGIKPPDPRNRPTIEEWEQRQERLGVNRRDRHVRDASGALNNTQLYAGTALGKLCAAWEEDDSMWLSEREHETLTRHVDRIEKYLEKIKRTIEACEVLPDIEPGEKPGDTIPVEWLDSKEADE